MSRSAGIWFVSLSSFHACAAIRQAPSLLTSKNISTPWLDSDPFSVIRDWAVEPALTMSDDHVKLRRSTVGYSMRWFRRHVRHGSLLALLALAINLALSFGHVHTLPGRHSDAGLIALITAAPTGNSDRSHDGDRQGHPDDLCPICMARAAMNNALAPTAPALPVQFASASIEHSSVLQAALVEPQRHAFNSRGPPVS